MDMISPDTSLALMQAAQSQSQQSAAATKNAKVKNIEQIEEAARDFEAMFVSEMMKPMFEGLKPNALFGGGKGEEVFQGLMLDEYGKLVAATGQTGIADGVKAAMIEMQEKQNHDTTGTEDGGIHVQ